MTISWGFARAVSSLSQKGSPSEYALNGYDALKMMQQNPFDVIITDLKMSSMGDGGSEAGEGVYPDSMVIVITGYARSHPLEVMKTGAYDYLPNRLRPRN
jgi:DNA-binding NtrC family response regulator